MAPNPLVPDAPEVDQVPLAFRTLGAQFLVAICWLGLLTWATLMVGSESTATTAAEVDPDALHVNLLLYGFSLGMVITGLVGWLLLRPVASTWRRFALTVVGVLGGFTLGMVATLMASALGGQPGLLAVAALALVGAVLLITAARRAAAGIPSQ